MPHAIDSNDVQQRQDDAEIARLLNNDTSGQPSDALDFLNRDLEVGEKADDAEDFEDIGDDDLASEEEDGPAVKVEDDGQDLPRDDNLTQAPDLEADFGDDLFGDEDNAFVHGDDSHAPEAVRPSKVAFAKPSGTRITLPTKIQDDDGQVYGSPASDAGSLADQDDANLLTLPATPEAPSADEDEEDEELDEAVALQRALFARAGRRGSREPPDAPETDMEVFFSIWPSYDPERTARFTELFPPVSSGFNWKAPLKPPKALQHSKLVLEIGPDTERAFNTFTLASSGKHATRSEFENPTLIQAYQPQADDTSSVDEIDLEEPDGSERIGGIEWKDVEMACCDWDNLSVSSEESSKRKLPEFDGGLDGELTHGHPVKRARYGGAAYLDPAMMAPLLPSFDDPELSTKRLAKRVVLNIDDPDLLLDESLPRNQIQRNTIAERGSSKDAFARDMSKRYNISNDSAYDLLKENHQHKIRSTLGNAALEHSMPAIKLQYPFYRVKLDPKQLRHYHRPHFSGVRVGKELRFSKLKTVKKKHLRGRETKDIFVKAEDLSMGDNSSGLLLEYSEEMPMVLSNFGMGNRLVNYYRRKDEQDTSRPKEDIGETQVLLPQDRSPFANFGYVDPGELVPAIQNSMYRAPIFKHDGKPSDFLVSCSTTHEGGSRFYLRNLENLHTVGQQFPLTEVPGEHSRKVTDAAKRRLKGFSYRIWRKYAERRGPPLTNQVVQAHLPGSDIAQNRGKMREFMKYDKNNSLWLPKDGDIPPDSDGLRSLIRPEDICLLDAMQVGVQHLTALGLRRDEDVNDDDDDKEGTNIELLLAPWSTTKNFMNACQGKAMLQLHGEGDPTGRGEGFSFIKTSMKGGFRALGESIEERLDAKKLKENHGHSYNVARQQKAYDESIRRIWRAQHESLSSRAEHSDAEMDIDDEADDFMDRATTPRASLGTPAFSRREDETVSQFSRNSTNRKNQTMIITRSQQDKFGNWEDVPVTITNPRVISAYKRAKLKEQAAKIDPNMIAKTGDEEFDALQLKAAEEELDRLHKAVERRHARQRAKGIKPSPPPGSPAGEDGDAGTPHGSGPGSGKRGGRKKQAAEGTGRRCANCGQIGHIKTNKKLCPMLNGTMKPEDIHMGFGGGGAPGQAAAAGDADESMLDDDAAQPTPAPDGMILPGMEI